MAFFQQTHRGRIRRLGSPSEEPEIFFEGEGRLSALDSIQSYGITQIRNAVKTDSEGEPRLIWEELDLEARLIRRHSTPFDGELLFEVTQDQPGLELILPDLERRPWVPLQPAEMPEPSQPAIGWHTPVEPVLSWSYRQGMRKSVLLEVEWSFVGLYRSWVRAVLETVGSLACQVDSLELSLQGSRDGELVFRSVKALDEPAALPAVRRLRLEPPLELVEDLLEEPRGPFDGKVPVTVAAGDFRATIEGAATRLVADSDLPLPFAAEVITSSEVVLPGSLPAGLVGAAPWEIRVSGPNTIEADGLASSSPRRLWRLEPGDRRGRAGSWEEIWPAEEPVLGFALGTADPREAPVIERVVHRQATVGWRIDPWEDQELLCLSVPQWLPAGHAECKPLPLHPQGFRYVSRVTAQMRGLDEPFTVDSSSELPLTRLFFGPDRWRIYDESGHEVESAEALGEVGGYVRWRRCDGRDPASPEGSRQDLLVPTDWAGGSPPVLVVAEPGPGIARWGGLFAPAAVPWDALRETPPRMSAQSRDVLLATQPEMPALWIDLWGFVCRYDRQRVTFLQTGQDGQPITAWIASRGLPLFPRGGRTGDFLLRSFNPLYVEEDREAVTLDFSPSSPRPTLRLGKGLLEDAPRVFELGKQIQVRMQVGEAEKVPETFSRGKIPGNRTRLKQPIGEGALWLAIEQAPGESHQRGYLLSWSASQGWLFRGFFTVPGGRVELGTVRHDLGGETLDVSPVQLCDGPVGLSFQLTIGKEIEWSKGAPETLRQKISDKEISVWANRFSLARDRVPAALESFEIQVLTQDPAVLEFTEPMELVRHDLGIRLWEPRDRQLDELSPKARARHIEVSPKGESPRDGIPKLLRHPAGAP